MKIYSSYSTTDDNGKCELMKKWFLVVIDQKMLLGWYLSGLAVIFWRESAFLERAKMSLESQELFCKLSRTIFSRSL